MTETDKGCEELVFNHLKQLFPNHKVIIPSVDFPFCWMFVSFSFLALIMRVLL